MTQALHDHAQEERSLSDGLRAATDSDLQRDLARVLNTYSAENASNTPDFILARYLFACLNAFNSASVEREEWYGKSLSINDDGALIVDESGRSPNQMSDHDAD